MSNNKRLIAKILNGENVVMKIDDNMLSCEFGALDRGNITDVLNWGIYANRGSISFIDNVGFFNNQNVNSTEIKNYTVEFYLMKNQESLISKFLIDDININEETKEVHIELVSRLLSIGSQKITGSVYPFYNRSVETLLSMVNEKFSFANVGIGDDSKNITYTYIDCPYIPVDTFWNVMTKLCQSTMSRIVETTSGEIEITGAFPERKPICLAPNNIINVENAGFVRIENGLIDVTERTTYNNRVLDGANKNFSIERKQEDGSFSDVNGFTVTDSYEKTEDSNVYRHYIKGSVNFNTPYKIFSLGIDKSIVNANLKMWGLSGTNAITEDREYTINTSLCSNAKIINETNIIAEVNELRTYQLYTEPELYANEIITKGGTIRFPISTFVDNGTTKISITSKKDGQEIPSNDLIQRFSSFFDTESQGEIPLGEYILQEIRRRYYHGVECFEIECLFNDYYDENGNIVFNGKDLSNHFKKYDVIIPYVMKKGQKVPLRKNPDGTPKKFRIIGISYSYDGLLRQKLSVQEERYDVD